MKKNILKVVLGIIICISVNLIAISQVNAASASISVKSNRNQVVVGNSFTVTVTVSSSEALGSWEYTMSYDSNKVKLTSGESLIVDYGNGSKKSQSYTYTFKAIASGSANITVKSYNVLGWDETAMSTNAGSANVTLITQAQLEASYSSDNNLKSLTVDGYEITPVFNKDTIEYKVILDSNIEKIKVNAVVNDSSATVTGIGEINVSEGDNKIELIVTAENGNKKTYTLIATVQDNNPITVTIDKKQLTVIKRSTNLTAPSTYTETTTTISDQEIPSFYSDITKFTLIGLKDTDGNTNLYIYDKNDNTYTKYTEVEFNKLLIYPTKSPTIPDGYTETTITIHDQEVIAYKINEKDEFSLIYGLNIETGKSHLYQYDPLENTISRYNDIVIKELNKKLQNYSFIIMVLGGETILLLLILLIVITKKNNNKKLIKKLLNETAIKKQAVEKQQKDDIKLEETKKIIIEKPKNKELKQKKENISDTQKLDKL